MYKVAVVQTPEILEARARMEAILAKHKQPKKPEPEKKSDFKLTPGMRLEANIKALQDGLKDD